MTGQGGDGPADLTRLTVNLTPRARAALGAVETLTGDSRTDVVNRALQVYALLCDVGQHDGAYRVEAEVAGAPLYLTACRTRPKRRWRPW
jgi:hypothetical protein